MPKLTVTVETSHTDETDMAFAFVLALRQIIEEVSARDKLFSGGVLGDVAGAPRMYARDSYEFRVTM